MWRPHSGKALVGAQQAKEAEVAEVEEATGAEATGMGTPTEKGLALVMVGLKADVRGLAAGVTKPLPLGVQWT